MIEYTVQVYKDKTAWNNSAGQLHREDGPAVEWKDGVKYWFINGQLHRTDGPAMEYPDGRKFWYLNHRELTEEEFNKRVNSLDGKIAIIDGIDYTLNRK